MHRYLLIARTISSSVFSIFRRVIAVRTNCKITNTIQSKKFYNKLKYIINKNNPAFLFLSFVFNPRDLYYLGYKKIF